MGHAILLFNFSQIYKKSQKIYITYKKKEK